MDLKTTKDGHLQKVPKRNTMKKVYLENKFNIKTRIFFKTIHDQDNNYNAILKFKTKNHT